MEGFPLGVVQPHWLLHPVSTVVSLSFPAELRDTYQRIHRKVDRRTNVGLDFALGRDKAVANAKVVTDYERA